MTTPLTRPRQATMGSWVVIAGSVVLVLLAYDQIATLGSLETQEQARQIVSEPPVDGLGVSAEAVREMLRISALVVGAGAAASVVLGVEALRRTRGARLALSIIVPFVLVAGLLVESFASALVAVGVLLLWSPPARDWFDGLPPRETARPTRPVPPAPTPTASGGPAPTPTTTSLVGGSSRAGSDPTSPSSPAGSWGLPAPGAAPAPWSGAPAPAAPARRPGTVVAACIVTWVMSGLTAAVFLITLAAVLAAPGDLYDQLVDQDPNLADQGLTQSLLVSGTAVGAAVVVPWCIAAAVVAVLAFRRVRWAWVALLVSAGLAGLLCLVSAVASFGAAVPLAACLATVVLLLRPETRAWIDAGRRGSAVRPEDPRA